MNAFARLFCRCLAVLMLAHAAWLLPATASAQNSKEATEAARAHRASKANASAAAAPNAPARAAAASRVDGNLKSCINSAGMNVLERDRCMRRYCEGRWGQGDCPAAGGDFSLDKVPNAGTPLGRCLKEAGKNPFSRERCAWQHCSGKWDSSAECRALKPKQGAQQNF